MSAQAREFAESYLAEDPALLSARSLADEIGLTAVSPAAGAALRLLAAAGNAKAVVEIGTGAGVSGLWLLRGMRVDGILTTIDVDPEHQRIARRHFLDAGYAASRTRVITGRALEVLPRLADSAYDLVFADAGGTECPAYVEAARRLLRPGGVLVVNGALAAGRLGDEEWIPALLPVGTGLLCAVRR